MRVGIRTCLTMPRKIAEFLLARSGSFWQKEVAPGAHAADADHGNKVTTARAVQQIPHRRICMSSVSHDPRLKVSPRSLLPFLL